MPLIWWATGVITVGIISLTKKTYDETEEPESYFQEDWKDLSWIQRFNYLKNLDIKRFTLIIGGTFVILKIYQTSADIYKTSKYK